MSIENIRILQALRERYPIAIVSAVAIFFVLPLVQSINSSLAFQIWFIDLQDKPLNAIPYIAFSVLFGIFISLYLYTNFKNKKCTDCCQEGAKTKHSKTGFIGTAIGFMLGVCPACFSFIGLLLPLGTSLVLTTYTPIFMLLSIAIIIFSIYKLGGFKSQAVSLPREETARDISKN